MNAIYTHQLPNGLWLLAEPTAGAQSLAMTLLVPAGVAAEPEDQQGVATMLTEMICRGAGKLDARAHADALDYLGVVRSTSAGSRFLQLRASMIGSKVGDALPLLLDMIRRPMLPAEVLEPVRDLSLQALDALEDEPQQKVFVELHRRHQPPPLGRSTLGRRADLQAMTLDHVRRFQQQTFVPGRSVLGFAGRFDWPGLREQVTQLLGDWQGTIPEPAITGDPQRGYLHEPAKSTQVHIGVAYDAPPEIDENSILQRLAVAVLSGGMSGRLFTEVREKRGLCYAVAARYGGDRERGNVLSYAGTTAPRAQETLDVLVGELHRLSKGVEPDEFERAVVGMKSHLVMQGESTSARAGAIASDQVIRHRPRSLEECARQVEAVTLDQLNDYVRTHPPGRMTIVTIGPDPLKTP